MKRLLLISFFILFISFPVFSQKHDSITYNFDIEEVTIRAPRIAEPLSREEAGTDKRKIDTFMLRDNLSVNMADLLSRSSSLFIKSYGRATLSTVSFRGTAPSHTIVTWNGMRINSPMLGMVDFSKIPSYFIDDVGIYRGASSINTAGGGFGGSIELSTKPAETEGFNINYIQGISSFKTFDQLLTCTFGNKHFSSSTKLYYVSSKNDFRYTNYRKKKYDLDNAGNIVSYHPVEVNKNGSFRDFHLLQDLYFQSADGSLWSGSIWYINSHRGIPMLNVDYRTDNNSNNDQTDNTLRAVVNWEKTIDAFSFTGKTGYNFTDLTYSYSGDTGGGKLEEMVNSRSRASTLFFEGKSTFSHDDKLQITGSVSLYQHFVKSIDRAAGKHATHKEPIGYRQARFESSYFIALKYRPIHRLVLSFDMREDLYGTHINPPVPALFVDYLVSDKGNVKLKSSFARNYRYPTLNDLYFIPGGNDSLKTEKGYTFDTGIEVKVERDKSKYNGEISVFNSNIKDRILWLPTFKGFWSPVNIQKVHGYGLEAIFETEQHIKKDLIFTLSGNYSITHSINQGKPINEFDESVGKQLVYIPLYSSAVTGKIDWRKWSIMYKWNYYSKRYTTSNNEAASINGVIGNYFMNDLSFSRSLATDHADFSIKFQINNLFNEKYESVLSHPMPGINFGIFVSITPKISKS